eukprot:COSAG02_NODE_1822_length_10761_cov_48.708685_4_plen_129_part_00
MLRGAMLFVIVPHCYAWFTLSQVATLAFVVSALHCTLPSDVVFCDILLVISRVFCVPPYLCCAVKVLLKIDLSREDITEDFIGFLLTLTNLGIPVRTLLTTTRSNPSARLTSIVHAVNACCPSREPHW